MSAISLTHCLRDPLPLTLSDHDPTNLTNVILERRRIAFRVFFKLGVAVTMTNERMAIVMQRSTISKSSKHLATRRGEVPNLSS